MSCHSGDSLDGWPAAVAMNSAATFVSVVDDDDSVRESLPSLLQEFGLTSKVFATPGDFFQSAFADKTACLILDIAMPGMSGPELRRELLRRGHDIPTIFITAHADCASRPEIFVGAVDCLVKPFSAVALHEALEKALNSQQHHLPRETHHAFNRHNQSPSKVTCNAADYAYGRRCRRRYLYSRIP